MKIHTYAHLSIYLSKVNDKLIDSKRTRRLLAFFPIKYHASDV